MSTSTRRSTRSRGGAASSSAAAAAASPLQPVATNTPTKKPAGKKAAAAKSNGAGGGATRGAKGRSKKSSSTAAVTATTGYTLRKRVASSSTTTAGDAATADDNTNPSTMMVNHASLYSDHQFEALLRRHEEDGARARADKRRRLEGPHPYRPNPDGTIGNGTVAVALDQLPGPVVTLVFEYLPRCRDVLNLACLSKYLLSYVERRTDLVIRAAVHENALAKIAPKKKGRGQEGEEEQQEITTSSGSIGWNGTRKVDGSRKIMTQIADDVRSRALRVPTPLRLLRLLCAQSCERGEGCWSYDAEKGTAGTRLGVDGAARPFGMAMCLQCSNDACRTVPRWWNHWGRTEEKILKIGTTKLFHPSAAADLTVGPDGERIGPFLDARQIMQLTSSYRNDGVDAQKEAFGRLCDEVYGKEGEDRYEEYEKAASEFVQLYDEAEESLQQFYAKQNDGREDNRKAIIERKKETLVQIIAILEEAVENLPDNLKALALEYSWRDNDTTLPLRFSLPLVHQKLVTFIRAPSYATQKRVDDAVASIRDSLNTFASHEEFTSFSFLTTPTAADHQVESEANRLLKSRLKQKLLNHVQQQDLSNPATLLSKQEEIDSYYYYPEDKFTPAFYDLLSRRSYKAALLNLLACRQELNGIVAATLVVDGDALEAGDPIDHRNLTTAIFNKIKVDEQYNTATSSFADFVDVLKLCKTEYTKLSRAARDYLQQPGVIEYLAGAPQWGGGFTRARAIGQVWKPKDCILRGRYYHWDGRNNIPEGLVGVKPYRLLSERKFDKLLEVHKYYQRNGTADGVH